MGRSRLVPRFISAWGFIAAVLLFVGTVLDSFGIFTGMSASAVEAILTIPIAVNEMVFAFWLIWKGFSPGVVTADPVGADGS